MQVLLKALKALRLKGNPDLLPVLLGQPLLTLLVTLLGKTFSSEIM